MNTQLNKNPVLKRYPPGDRWIPHDCPSPPPEEMIFETLTDALEWVYKQYKTKKFIVDAEEQIVYSIEKEEKVKKPTDNKYSIYGE